MSSDEELTAEIRKAEPLMIRLDTSWLIDRETMASRTEQSVQLFRPGATPRSKAVKVSPLLVGSHADMLRWIADQLSEESSS